MASSVRPDLVWCSIAPQPRPSARGLTMARYHFVTEFRVAAPRRRAWEVFIDTASWPSWWRWLDDFEVLAEGDGEGVGARHRLVFRTPLRYRLTTRTEVVAVQPPALLENRAEGELAGIGRWDLEDVGSATAVRYTWIVATTKRWMNVIAPLARPVFGWNHDRLMRDFARGFADALGAPLLSIDSRALRPGRPGFGQLPGTPPT